MYAGILAGSVLLLSAVSCGAAAVNKSDELRLETFIVIAGDKDAEEPSEKVLPSDLVPDPWTTTSQMPKEEYKKWCKDAPAEKTGFEVHTREGFLGHANCLDLATKCHNWEHSLMVQDVCPVSCFVCDPDASQHVDSPPCYDSVVTGVRFKQGPKASCTDLALYCNHSTLYYHVQAACRLTCGLCAAHVGHVGGDQCVDLEAHDQPEFMVSGQRASCSDLTDFCGSGGFKESYLIRHKCPKTCGACPQPPPPSNPWGLGNRLPTSAEASSNSEDVSAGCDRRRRWGFCETRRRRNL